jgi:hypothetical protein
MRMDDYPIDPLLSRSFSQSPFKPAGLFTDTCVSVDDSYEVSFHFTATIDKLTSN